MGCLKRFTVTVNVCYFKLFGNFQFLYGFCFINVSCVDGVTQSSWLFKKWAEVVSVIGCSRNDHSDNCSVLLCSPSSSNSAINRPSHCSGSERRVVPIVMQRGLVSARGGLRGERKVCASRDQFLMCLMLAPVLLSKKPHYAGLPQHVVIFHRFDYISA